MLLSISLLSLCNTAPHAVAQRSPLQTSERLRVEIVSVDLKPESRAAHDPNVVRLFVEYSLLDLPSEETPLSLPKPAPGQSVHYNYSNGELSRHCFTLW